MQPEVCQEGGEAVGERGAVRSARAARQLGQGPDRARERGQKGRKEGGRERGGGGGAAVRTCLSCMTTWA